MEPALNHSGILPEAGMQRNMLLEKTECRMFFFDTAL